MEDRELEFEDVFLRVKSAIRLSAVSIMISLTILLIVKIFNLMPITQYLTEMIAALIIWLITIVLLNFYVDRAKTISGIENVYFIVMVENILLLDWLVYNIGGVEWLGPVFYLFPVVYGNIIFSRVKGFLITTITGLNYVLLLFLEYFNIIPFRKFFTLGVNFHNDSAYVLTTVSFMIFTFYAIGLAVNILTDFLRKRTLALEKTKLELEELQSALEIRIKARTKELEELTQSLDQKVVQRTNELQERINELERFHELTVGRELKMIELKEEIKKLNNQLKKAK
ncbi:MAG: hypothetical protein ABH967_01475 [Patescibacteria group bacterium]